MNDCSLGDNSPPVFSWLELVAEETGCNPGDTFEGQVAAGFILNNLKRNIQPISQKPDCTPHRRSHVYLSWRDFPGRDDDTRPVNQLLYVAHVGKNFLGGPVDEDTLLDIHLKQGISPPLFIDNRRVQDRSRNTVEGDSTSRYLYSQTQKVPSEENQFFFPLHSVYAPLCAAAMRRTG